MDRIGFAAGTAEETINFFGKAKAAEGLGALNTVVELINDEGAGAAAPHVYVR